MSASPGAGAGGARPSLGEAVRVYATVGLVNFGGPAGQIALMHRIFVEERKWVSEARFLHALNFCMLLPGPEAQQLATYVGWLLHGTRGGIAAGILFILPGLAVILGLSAAYAAFHGTPWLDTLFFGVKAAVLAIVLEAVIRIGRRALKTWTSVAIAAVAFVAIFALRVPFPAIILGAGLTGLVLARLSPATAPPPAVPEDDGPRPTLRGLAATVAVWGALWAAPVVLLGLAFGFESFFPALGLFFSKMAVVTFGGAYAVLAYVAQQAADYYHWVTPREMLDGLGMAETTPGPLIMVVQFVGFMASFR
ncbi:MAG TPA: chromate efflux transporter, partial [Bauldia sp.]|nr:chromate efflux transporter [Bauldia sp.]